MQTKNLKPMKMRSIKYIQRLTGIAALLLTLFACSPEMDDAVDIGPAPTEDQLDFTILSGRTILNLY
jgi:hypothetical protein